MSTQKVCLAILALLSRGSALRGDLASFIRQHGLGQHNRSLAEGQLDIGHGVTGKRDLVFMHIPYNFGHTVEKVAMMKPSASVFDLYRYMSKGGGAFTSSKQISWHDVWRFAKRDAEIWGHLHPELQSINPTTKCNNYYTPQKYWPKELAENYFQNKTIVGLLRDPAERLVAMFRGDVAGYGGGWDHEYVQSCDVNNGVKHALKEHISSGNDFSQACTFVPQAAFFEGPYGIQLPVDNRKFPESMNKVFAEHGYPDMHIAQKDILHVTKCKNVWAADLDSETRALIRQVYARDYELLCKHFGYCDTSEDTCITGVREMCPAAVLKAKGLKNP